MSKKAIEVKEETSTAVVVAALEKQADKTIKALEKIVITDQDQYDRCAELLEQLKAKGTEAKAEEDSMTKGLKQSLKAIRKHFQPFEKKIAAIELKYKTAMIAFLEEQDKKIAAVEKQFETGKIKKINTFTSKVKAFQVTNNGSATVRKIWAAEIVNESDIPREYMMPNMEKIKAALKEGKQIKGVKYVQKKNIAI